MLVGHLRGAVALPDRGSKPGGKMRGLLGSVQYIAPFGVMPTASVSSDAIMKDVKRLCVIG